MIKQSSTLLYLLIKNQLKRIHYLLLLIIAPIVLSIIINNNILSTTNKNIVGLYNSGNDDVAIASIDRLLEGDYQVQFVNYADRNEMLSDIANGRIDCGYEFDDRLTRKITGNFNNAIVLYLDDSESLVASYTNELVFSAVLNSGAHDILMDYVTHDRSLNTPEAIEIIDNTFSSYVINKDVFSVQKEEFSSDGINAFDIDSLNSTSSVRSLVGIVVMLSCFIGAITRANNVNSESFEIMRKSVYTFTAFIYPIAYAIPVTLSMVGLLILTGSTYGAIDILNVISLLIASVTLAGLLSLGIRNSRILAGAVPNILMICIFIYPVIFDLIMFAPILKWVRFLLPPQYINLF